MWVGLEEIEKHGQDLQERFANAPKIPGTRENHAFIPHSSGLHISRVYGTDTHFVSSSSNCATIEPTSLLITPGCYVACLYDGLWWIGSIRSVFDKNNDYEVIFMHPHGPSKSFRWPQREDICWVPQDHILGKIKAPSTLTGRSYVMANDDSATVHSAYLRLKAIF